MAVTTILLTVLLSLILFHWWTRGGRRGKLLQLLPGPTAYPVVGNLLLFPTAHDDIFDTVRKINKEFYPLYKLWSMTTPIVNVIHPDDVEIVLSSTKYIEKSYLYNFIKPWLNTGLLTSTGTKWQKRRKILTPTFHFSVLQQFSSVFVREGIEMVEALKAENGAVVKDIMKFVSFYTLNSICETAMGVSLKDKSNLQYKYREAVEQFCRIVPNRLFRPWMTQNELIFALTPLGHVQSKTLNVLHDFTKKIITERKEYHEQTNGRLLGNMDKLEKKNVSKDDNLMTARKKKMAMLDLLIGAFRNNEIDDDGIREEVDTITFEGHDTTAMGLGYTFLLLAKHKDVQELVRKEVNEVMLEYKEELTMQALQKLNYLERCIKETLRLYPSVPFIGRYIREDLQLKHGLIPANTVCHVHIYDIHRDPNFWPNADKFEPDRFLPENTTIRHPFSYIPFSAGPRNCIGQRFAMLELKAITAYIIRNFYLEPVDELDKIRMRVDLVLRPAYPVHIKFVPINK